MKIRFISSFVLVLAAAVFSVSEGSESGYLVGAGDVLEVTAFQHQELCGSFQVSEDGVIAYPLIGRVEVVGRTAADIGKELERLLELDYFVDVQLSVEVREHMSQPVVILGEVRRPGTVFLSGKTMLTEILAEAGGLASGAGPEIEIRRVAGGEVLVFSTEKVRTGEEGRDVEVRVGDVISVSSKRTFFITGEINQPGQYEIPEGLTLMRALSQAGGSSKFASREVEIHREVGGEKRIETHDMVDIRKGRIDDPPILADDVIIVRRRFF